MGANWNFPSLKMTSKKDILSRYKSNPVNIYQGINNGNGKKKKGNAKYQQLMIIDDDNDFVGDADNDELNVDRNVSIWATGKARNLEREEDEMEEAAMEVFVDHEENFKTAFTSSNWNTIADGNRPIESRGREMARSRSSPSPSPSSAKRSSPSPSPSSRRKSPSMSLSPSRKVRRPSPSPSPRNKSRKSSDRAESHKASIKMSDGTLSGLQSGQAIKKQIDDQRATENRALESSIPSSAQQTVYRDTKTGKKVDIEAKKQELLNLQSLKKVKEQKEKDWGRGLIQTQQELAEKHRLLEEEKRGLAVYADDNEQNQVLKEKVRWGDAMAGRVSNSSESKKIKKSGKRAVYQGPAPTPNRYSIPPGYRWDGVDRSNGFELKVFRSKHQFAEVRKEYDRWAMEDM